MQSIIVKELNKTERLVFVPKSVTVVSTVFLYTDTDLYVRSQTGAGVHLIMHGFKNNEHITVEAEANAHVTVTMLIQGNRQMNVNLRCVALGSGANMNVQIVGISQESSESTIVCGFEHQVHNTVGRITSRRIAYGASKNVFKGLLKIAPGAQKTDTYLSDKALTIGDKATAVSDPQLEILADDVRASHGATIGQLSQDELFYLRARGLPYETAKNLLLHSFIEPALVGVPRDLINILKLE